MLRQEIAEPVSVRLRKIERVILGSDYMSK
jgi:hypothetical protein